MRQLNREPVPRNTELQMQAKVLVAEREQSTVENISALEQHLQEEFPGLRVRDAAVASAEGTSSRNIERARRYMQPVIVDVGRDGKGIDHLIDGTATAEQQFSGSAVFAAAQDAQLIHEGRATLLLGAGGVLVDHEGAQVVAEAVEGMVRSANGEQVAPLTKAAFHSQEEGIQIGETLSDTRVLLQNVVLFTKGDPSERQEGQGVVVEYTVPQEGAPQSMRVVLEAVRAQLGFEHVAIRGTVTGNFIASLAVITELPQEQLENIEQVKEVLQSQEREGAGTFHFSGSDTTAASRKSERWGSEAFTGEKVYSKGGHLHGFGRNEQGALILGGHVHDVQAHPGARIELIIEAATVAQVTNTNER